MLKLTQNNASQEEIIATLEAAAQDYFKCSLQEYLRRLDAHELPKEKGIIIDMMDTWLQGVNPDHSIIRSRHPQLSVANY